MNERLFGSRKGSKEFGDENFLALIGVQTTFLSFLVPILDFKTLCYPDMIICYYILKYVTLFLQVLLVTLQRSTVGQVEMNLGEKDLNITIESSDNSTNYGENEGNMGFWTENTECTPGKRQDPWSCTSYFLCVEVLPRVFREYYSSCPPNLVYNSHTSECVSPYFYQCAVRILHRPYPRPPRPPPFYPPIWPPIIIRPKPWTTP